MYINELSLGECGRGRRGEGEKCSTFKIRYMYNVPNCESTECFYVHCISLLLHV